MLDLFWLIPFLPLIGFLINGIGIKWVPKQLAGLIACSVVGIAFAIAVGAFLELRSLPVADRSVTHVMFPWIMAGQFNVNVAFLWDQLSSVMVMIVTGVGFLIHVYSLGYMKNDPGFKRYFAYLNLFTFAMLLLVMGDNFLLLFVGWEGVGLCSYLLIGFWYQKDSATDAGKKAFIVNRIGDFGVLLGMFLVYWNTGSLTFVEVFERAPAVFIAGAALPTAITLLFFLGATGKSAQLPLYVWLPDAMEGPTPVSALIHAATMVTAGVYLFARASGLFAMAPDAMMVVAIVGALTAFMAATIGLVQNDIKRVLAYSTVSQLGYMFLAVGSGAYIAAIFHLMTHAFFKALLFLGSGSVIEACHHEQDMRKMGGLRKKMPITSTTFMIGSLALAGVPIFAGFFSKDEILYNTFTSGTLGAIGPVLWVIGALAALMTAFYITRAVAMTFYGEPKDKEIHDHAHESPSVMTVPLMILAVASTVGGFLGIPIFMKYNVMHNWLGPLIGGGGHGAHGGDHGAVTEHGTTHLAAGPSDHGGGHAEHNVTLEVILMGISVAIALFGIVWAWQNYVKHPKRAEAMGARFPGLYKLLDGKWFVDEFYNAVIVVPIVGFSKFLWTVVDSEFVDGLVNGTGKLMRGIGSALRPVQSGLTPNYATAILVGAIVIMGYVVLGGAR
ncbi:MAG: NADH-quinone oxidoreductase subunit L [Candidatus Eisenbacteria bacterium]|uniref:NADH-quinone oxidoreductase subunit L n=1 Tax=Eiseniibacteriota bacterium TaxID=2212470 RepID=A0A7Y2E4V5_UNCEI|nr:NADH-quinone oxidoreductase subunit L [Candidatus Eisenbacteria bacterium]